MTVKKGGHPGIERGYALDFLAPIRYVADALERRGGLSSAELSMGYVHYLGGDIERVKGHEGLDSNGEANTFLVERALLALGKQAWMSDDGKWSLTKPLEDLKYENRKLFTNKALREAAAQAQLEQLHERLRNPFDPLTGRFSENIRRHNARDTMDELRESMREFGWVPEFPALIDERGVVLVGHRRLTVAAELGIEPVQKILKIGSGDEADARRLKLALVSNIGFKELTPEERKDIAEYLYGERDWSQARIAQALNVSQKTISKDLGGYTQGITPKRGGRPRKLTPELEEKVVEGHFEEGKTRNEVADEVGLSHGLADIAIAKEKARREVREAMESPPQPLPQPPIPVVEDEAFCLCPNCGHRFAPSVARA